MNKDVAKMTIALTGIILFLVFVFLTTNEAHAEDIPKFYGLDSILKDPNSVVKLYNSGGFFLKNYDLGIAIFAHPIDKTNIFKFTVIQDGKVSRFIAETEPSVKIEPQSSLGADITKWDIPTNGRKEHIVVIPEIEHDPSSLDVLINAPKTIQYKHNFNFELIAIDKQIKSQKDQRLQNVSVNASIINPIGEITHSWTGLTNNFGSFPESFYVVDNQMLGQYILQAMVNKTNYDPKTITINFFVIPLDEGGSRKCPVGYSKNLDTGLCQEVLLSSKEKEVIE